MPGDALASLVAGNVVARDRRPGGPWQTSGGQVVLAQVELLAGTARTTSAKSTDVGGIRQHPINSSPMRGTSSDTAVGQFLNGLEIGPVLDSVGVV